CRRPPWRPCCSNARARSSCSRAPRAGGRRGRIRRSRWPSAGTSTTTAPSRRCGSTSCGSTQATTERPDRAAWFRGTSASRCSRRPGHVCATDGGPPHLLVQHSPRRSRSRGTHPEAMTSERAGLRPRPRPPAPRPAASSPSRSWRPRVRRSPTASTTSHGGTATRRRASTQRPRRAGSADCRLEHAVAVVRRYVAMLLLDLADACRGSGLRVVEVDGWQSRGHGQMSGVRTIVCHHTAGPPTGEVPSLNFIRDRGLAQLVLGRSGTVYVVAAGLCFHAGVVHEPNMGNRWAIGIEAEATGTAPWPMVQYQAYARLCAALAGHYRVAVARVLGHKEVAAPTGRKIDPNFDMVAFRALVADHLEDDMFT